MTTEFLGQILEKVKAGLQDISHAAKSPYDSLGTMKNSVRHVFSSLSYQFGCRSIEDANVKHVAGHNVARFYRGDRRTKTLDLIWIYPDNVVTLACQIDAGITKESIQKLTQVDTAIRILVSISEDMKPSIQRMLESRHAGELEKHGIIHLKPDSWFSSMERRAKNMVKSAQ